MNELNFLRYMKHEDGHMARVKTENEMPLNIYVDNYSEHQGMEEGMCLFDIHGIGSEIESFSTVDEYRAIESLMAEISLIPVGTFALPDDDSWVPSPYIIFSGIVESVSMNPSAGDSEPNCCLTVKTLDIVFDLYIRTAAVIEEGFIVRGTAWLFGDIHSIEKVQGGD